METTRKRLSKNERDYWITEALPGFATLARDGRKDHVHNLRWALRAARKLGIGKRAIERATLGAEV